MLNNLQKDHKNANTDSLGPKYAHNHGGKQYGSEIYNSGT